MATCIITNCRGYAPSSEPFCAKHRDKPAKHSGAPVPGDGGAFVAGPSWKEPEDDCWTAEVQIVGGHYVVATVHGADKAEAEARQAAIITALAANPMPGDGGWIVGSVGGKRWRAWTGGCPEWTTDRDLATRYARREDAEEVHLGDEDAWTIEPYAIAHAAPAPSDGAGVPAGMVPPIDMLLFCPKCGIQHIDWPDDRSPDWDNPPHRSHLCHACGCIWRPADVPTNGVAAITTQGKADTWGESNSAALPKQATPTDEAASQGWRPIETAPKWRQRILGWNAEYGVRETCMMHYQVGSPGFAQHGPAECGWEWIEEKHNSCHRWEPTHWQPLPKAPETPAPGSAGEASDV